MAVLTTKTEIPNEVSNVYIKEHLMMETDHFVFEQFARNFTIETKSGTPLMKVRRYNTLAPATTPLNEGVTPGGSKVTSVMVDIPVEQYGDFVEYTDVLDLTSADDIVLDFMRITGDQRFKTRNILCRNKLLAGTNVTYAGGKTARNQITSANKITEEFLNNIEKTLKKGHAKKVTKVISTDDAVSMVPVDAAYVVFIGLEGAMQLRSLEKFTPVENYRQNGKTYQNEVGKHGSLRFIETSDLEVLTGQGASGANIEQLVAFGMEAYGRGQMRGDDANDQVIVKDRGENGADQLNQRGSIGWKTYAGYAILNQKFLVRGEYAV